MSCNDGFLEEYTRLPCKVRQIELTRIQRKGNTRILPVLTERLPVEGLAAISFLLPFRRQKTSAKIARKATTEEPRTMPIIGPTASPFFLVPSCGLDGWPLEPGFACAAGGEWLRLLPDLPGGGGVYGGGGGAGPFANEFPLYLVNPKQNFK